MVWSRILLDGIAMGAVFNLTVALLWLIYPNAFATMLPKEIKKAAPPVIKKEVITMRAILFSLYPILFAWMVISAYQADIQGFWNLFWAGYIEMMFLNIGDLIGLDWLFKDKFKDKIMIPGTENCKAWNNSVWMKKMGFPEHLIAWPLAVCPAVGFICAGIGCLIR